jgi:hypothetical protein
VLRASQSDGEMWPASREVHGLLHAVQVKRRFELLCTPCCMLYMQRRTSV